MEVNKEQAELCRDIGARAMKEGDFPKALKMLRKSLQLYPLPGVAALLSHAESQVSHSSGANSDQPQPNSSSESNGRSQGENSHSLPTRSASSTGADGRTYTDEQVSVVNEVLKAKEGGRGAHYRVLKLDQNCTETEIKKAYRKLSLKVHPDKNSAPHADEAFKAVGLAYATLSDPQKREIYDRYGEEDPDNRAGGVRPGGGVHMNGQEVSPEEIFNMFFGGGMGGMPGMHRAGPGFHVYTTGFGPGMQFGTGPNVRRQRREQQFREERAPFSAIFFQLLPVLLIMLVSFFRYDEHHVPRSGSMPGEGQYFSMTRKPPFINPLKTQQTTVRDIPFFVTDNFIRTYYRNRQQLWRVERMVEVAYEQYLLDECTKQQSYKIRLRDLAFQEKDEQEKERKVRQVKEYELSRCQELVDLYPSRKQHVKLF